MEHRIVRVDGGQVKCREREERSGERGASVGVLDFGEADGVPGAEVFELAPIGGCWLAGMGSGVGGCFTADMDPGFGWVVCLGLRVPGGGLFHGVASL
jgi:hypothetical protein